MRIIFLLTFLLSITSHSSLLSSLRTSNSDSPITEEDKIVSEVKRQLTIQDHPYFMKINLYSNVDIEKLTDLLKKENLIVFPLVENELNILVSFDKINSMKKIENTDYIANEFHKILVKLWNWIFS